MHGFFRIIKFAFQDMVRNISLSLMTILILVLMLLSINTLLLIQVLTTEATNVVKDEIDVSIFFSHDATDEEIAEVRSYIDQFPEVVETTYFTKEEELERFKSVNALDSGAIAALEELGENPLGPSMVIKTREPSDYQKIITALQVPEYDLIIESKNFGDTEVAIERIDTITQQVERFSLALSALFAVIAFLIIFNTIRVAIYTHRTEISIKKLVGATNWFVRGPYLLEALIFSIISVGITFVLVALTIRFLDPHVAVVFQREGILTEYLDSNILMLLGIQFVAVLLLTILSSLLAMRRHLRV